MPDWKVTGEVPDSEDDDAFDSQNSLPAALPDIDIQASPKKVNNPKDVWDVPSSQGSLAEADITTNFDQTEKAINTHPENSQLPPLRNDINLQETTDYDYNVPSSQGNLSGVETKKENAISTEDSQLPPLRNDNNLPETTDYDWEFPFSQDELARPSTPLQQRIVKQAAPSTPIRPTEGSDSDSPLTSLASSPAEQLAASRSASLTPRQTISTQPTLEPSQHLPYIVDLSTPQLGTENSQGPPPRPSREPPDNISLLSSQSSSEDLPSLEQLIAPQKGSDPPKQSDPRGPKRTPLPQDEISRGNVDITSPIPNFEGPDDNTEPLPGPRAQAPFQNQILGHDEELEEARRVAVLNERSLRKRKPEQIRPYYTEMARFTNEWRSHGLRPVRIANVVDERREMEKSPEPDFEPESQGSAQQDVTDESQGNDRADFLDPPYDAVASSSPEKASPLVLRGDPSSRISSQDTENTSVDWEGDLPSLDALTANIPKSARKEAMKRKSALTYSAKRKGRRSDITADAPSSERGTRFIRPPDSPKRMFSLSRTRRQSPGPASLDPFETEPEDVGVASNHQQLASAAPRAAVVIESDSDGGQEIYDLERDEEETQSGSSSDTEEEMVNKVKTRIRGVLPASWLRLDKLSGLNKIQKNVGQRSIHRSPERENKRGVAQRRFTRVGSAAHDLLFEESDEETPSNATRTTDDIFHNQRTLQLEPLSAPIVLEHDFSDSEGSIMEDDHIDRMVSSKKRQMKLADSFIRQPKRAKTGASNKSTPARARQPKITSTFNNSRGSVSATKAQQPKKRASKSEGGSKSRKSGVTKARSSKRHQAPQLSILDVIESNAPQFLKIAARTARQRPNQGRDGPGRKNIQLATRDDHIDAFSVLKDWRIGSIPQRPSVTAAKKTKQPRPPTSPLKEKSSNARPKSRQTLIPAGGAPRKFTKQISDGGSVSIQPQKRSQGTIRAPQSHISKEPSRRDRPGQLEIEDTSEMNRFAFHSGKKLLDHLYHNKYGDPYTTGSVISAPKVIQSLNHAFRIKGPGVPIDDDNEARPAKQLKKVHIRKRKPQQLDIEAPQYSRAHDPLPDRLPVPMSGVSTPGQELEPLQSGIKLLGLGPYGTHYTHHFEIFPLDSRVYFHESTLIGSGAIDSALREDYCENLKDAKPRVFFVLGEKTLRWGPWDDQVSSEMGIVFDFIADQLSTEAGGNEKIIGAVNHLLTYVKDSMSFDRESDAKSFIDRIMEAMQSFDKRIASTIEDDSQGQGLLLQSVLRTYDRILLVALLTLRICRSHPSFMSEQYSMEALLKSVATTKITVLCRVGLQGLKKTYSNLRTLRFRERGLRDESRDIHSWVVVMRVLESAKIKRGSFWDIIQGVWIPPQTTSSVKAHEHERIWENMFTLLPLAEFNNTGVLVAARRQQTATEGWAIPQMLLSRVFGIYRQNTSQSPSFNNYCRALVGRCHYLVEQWGWRKCSGIIGVIFDFFGSQNLAHLRNEEFYSSPRFLSELAQRPKLEIEPEDRCFHIFLKLVALAIVKLKESGSTKDIPNLILRTTPNHNRQYLKEQMIHERDLAALRNHHDLLVTLYWAATSDLRSTEGLKLVGLIETLVTPASSHKEACLINFRAWNQLTRYIVATGEAPTFIKPFNQWRNTFFQQIMQQYDSVASDIEHQFQGLSKDVSKSISPDMISAMVAMNKAAVTDVLHFSVTASLDVMKHAPDLEAATWCLNTLQLQQVFKRFAVAPPEFDWTILRAALSTLDIFLCRIDEFKDNEGSQESESQILNSEQADDALQFLSHDVAGSYFSMARCALSNRGSKELTALAAVDKATCAEEIVTLAARMGMRFINAGVMNLADMFKPGKYGLFQDLPHKLGFDHRRYLTLFITTLLKHGFDDFDSAGFTLLELWALSIVRPKEVLAFEHKLAEQLVHQGKSFVPATILDLTISPDYNTNRDLFEFAITSMRQSIRDASPSLKKILQSEHSKTLKQVMDQIKDDLKILSSDPAEHHSYVIFIRRIIFLIRSHGSDITAIDDFFYQINKEYSPLLEDLQVAGVVAYGLRLAEGDARVAHQLFFFLFNNFKVALINDKLDEVVAMLRKGMANSRILGFVLGKMVPAVLHAAAVETGAWPLVEVYVNAFCGLFGGFNQIAEEHLSELSVAFGAVVRFLAVCYGKTSLSDEEVHLVRHVLSLMNIFWPSIYNSSFSASSPAWDGIKSHMSTCRKFTASVEETICDLIELDLYDTLPTEIFTPIRHATSAPNDAYITSFADNIITDIRRNWTTTNGRISIQAPTRGTQTQPGQGVLKPMWEVKEVIGDLYERVGEWNYWWDKVFGEGKGGADVCQLALF